MAEQNMVSIEKLDEIMNDYFPAVEVVDWHGAELEVKKKIPAAVMYDLVRNVADACFDKETGEYWIDVRPVKPGKTTLNLYVDSIWFDSSPNYKITVNIADSACFTEKNCPPLKYNDAMADAQSAEGQPVSLKGKFLRVFSAEGSSPVQFEIASKGKACAARQLSTTVKYSVTLLL